MVCVGGSRTGRAPLKLTVLEIIVLFGFVLPNCLTRNTCNQNIFKLQASKTVFHLKEMRARDRKQPEASCPAAPTPRAQDCVSERAAERSCSVLALTRESAGLIESSNREFASRQRSTLVAIHGP
jgi:hypothetical protein